MYKTPCDSRRWGLASPLRPSLLPLNLSAQDALPPSSPVHCEARPRYGRLRFTRDGSQVQAGMGSSKHPYKKATCRKVQFCLKFRHGRRPDLVSIRGSVGSPYEILCFHHPPLVCYLISSFRRISRSHAHLGPGTESQP